MEQSYPLPNAQYLKGFTGIVCAYGEPLGEYILTKHAAESMLKQGEEHPERFNITYENKLYKIVRIWIEGDDERGRVMAEYERVEP